MAIFSPPVEIWLLRMETTLREQLDSDETPFLGLYSDLFTESSRESLRKTLGKVGNPFGDYLRALERWPAVFAAYLTVHVVDGFGTHGDAAVYPFVARAVFGAERQFTLSERDRLWRAYRRACVRLGLDVVPDRSATNYMVAEYLHQAGVPVHFLSVLTRRMLRHAKVVGIPDADDPEGVGLWQAALLDRLGPPVPITVARAVQSDRGGFYPRLFLRALAGESALPTESENSVYALMVEAVGAAGGASRRLLGQALAIPKVIWRDDLLGVELPASLDAKWRIEVAGETQEYTAGSDPRFIPFDYQPLPGEVRIACADGSLTKSFELWADGRNNRFLVFDSAGQLDASSRLNPDGPVLVEPGALTLVTRFRPDGEEGGIMEICNAPALYRQSVDLAPGESLTLERGSAQVTILARSHPTLALSGQAFRGIGGNELYASAGLHLRGRVPVELVEEGDFSSLLVTLSVPSLSEPLDFPVQVDGNGGFELDLEKLCCEWKPGLSRLRIELRREGLRRPMVRLAAWLWSGLERIEERVRFHCARLPANLNSDLSDNLSVDEPKRVVGYRSDAKRFFRLVFDLESNRNIQFTGVVPGAFMVLKRFREEQVIEQPLRKGAVLALRPDSREVLEVHSSQGGILSLGGMRQEISPHFGMRKLHLSALAQYLEPGVNRLCIELPSGVVQPLLQLVTPHRVLRMSSRLEGGMLSVRLDLPAAADALRCTARDVLTGEEVTLDIAGNDASARLDRATLAWLSCGERQAQGEFRHTLELPLERWCSGAWLLHVEARLNGRWGSLVNEREDVYAWGFLLDETGAPTSSQWLMRRLAESNQTVAIRIFKQVHRALLPCYASDVWSSIAWLAAAWQNLARALAPADGQTLTELLALDALVPPEAGQESWFPLLLPGVALPWIYSRTSESYRGVGKRAGLIGNLGEIRSPLSALFLLHYLDPIAAFGFGNVMQMQQGIPPSGFSMGRYRQAMAARNLDDVWSQLSREDWQPTEGDYLGPVHWRFALGSLEARYRATLHGNKARRGWALQLLRDTHQLDIGDLVDGLPAHLLDTNGLGLLTQIPEDGWSQEQENLTLMTGFLCWFAAVCRWECRAPGTLDVWRRAVQVPNLPDGNALIHALGYLLFVGRDVFEFYLMLWELLFAADADAADVEMIDV